MPRLIVNADDFGYTEGINRAIVELAERGALRSTTLMAYGAAFPAAVAAARLRPQLGIGCHVVLVDGTPILPPEQVLSLLDTASFDMERPHFRTSLAVFARDQALGRIDTRELEAEIAAQIAHLQAHGVRVTHLDSHKHTHMFPRVLRPLLRAALARGIPAVRNPFEPHWARQATSGAPLIRRMEVRVLSRLRGEFLRAIAEAGLRTTAGALGVLATGTLNDATLRALLAAMPPGDQAWELVCHPGHVDAALAELPTRLQSEREIEYAALADVLPRIGHMQQIHFGEL